jgi:hypothetical protein
MIKQTLILFLILTFTLSCDMNDKDEIELFLLNKRIESFEGIPIIEHDSFIKTEKNLELAKYINIDTITNHWIFGGKYDVELTDLNQNPLISDNEIIGINIQKSELILSNSGKAKIKQLKPNMKHGIQFVICVNRQPYLTGYFRSNISSNIYNWNYIGYDYIEHKFETNNDKNFVIRQNDGYEKWKPILCNLNQYPELVSAFRNTNRIIE